MRCYHLIHLFAEEDDDDLVARSSSEQPEAKRCKIGFNDRGSDVESGDGVDHDSDCALGSQGFMPLYLISIWTETFTTRKCVSVAIWLPSGVESNYRLFIVNGGNTLQLWVKLPTSFTNIRKLRSLWIVMEGGRRVGRVHAKKIDLKALFDP